MALNKGYLTAKSDSASDEYYTPKNVVEAILEFIPKNSRIWCPFDLEEYSQYVKVLRAAGHSVISSHIDNGENFFFYKPEEDYDYIISNPPFSAKDAVLARLNEIGKPWMMLLPLPTLQGQKRFDDLKDCGAIIFDKRVNYYQDKEQTKMAKGVAFASIYIFKGFDKLEKLIFKKLENS